ncbi:MULTISPECIES: YqcC family protein [unclassified Halomonas]|uniref:YqcC family protein n=1 Tax=unclassified Halomonas TaxID=2609666 RepID=UPI001CF1AF06|nr:MULTISPECIES: YqcC family protein [unclassified Halomonas]MCA8866428.1 YqcC family protein [Halomonas sp. SBBP1]UZH08388.1 YqcC family protein [Halomonas sp. BDJS001]
MSTYQPLQTALLELEASMKAADLWRMSTPDAEAFASQQPFCIDTMSLPQWIRFVFIARLNALMDARAAMPAKCEVAPAVAAYLQQEKTPAHHQLLIVRAVEKVDQIVTEST